MSGLPLAANVAGGVLCRCKSVQDWHSIKENWLSDSEEGKSISNILKLSYDHLTSPSLKKCFAYCSIFPKGWEINKEELIELWMAEGFLFLQPSRRDDMEYVGNMFCNVLLQNSLLQAARTDSFGREYYMMHDLVHDLASSVLSNNADGSIRYKFLENDSSRIPEEVSRNLRTLLLEGGSTFVTLFSNYKCLHNLSLYGLRYKELPSSIRKLIHLRNLNISKTSITNIPEWIGELHHLQTLRSEIWYLKELPDALKYLINLRHLYVYSETKLPAEIGRLTSLQTLELFKVGEEKGYQIEELGSLKNLKGTLMIENLERVRDKEDAMKANMLEKSCVSTLMFSWDNEGRVYEINDESVLEGLQPHANLKVLRILGFKGKRFPRWCQKMAVWDELQGSWETLDSLTEITLSNCSECEEIPTLVNMLNLETLRLHRLEKVEVSALCRCAPY
ncbi:disease resistance protein RGA2-like isoform X2 [Salvia hispanica]|uniref:disease resistance protein RGA2-like isoform X2 n=1 Tax=Salvia hispanica TaxID=49212 RepID=UPI0020097130|nr:disease resistance protein RGA2-like isoform X2 [Salvia hispanica]